MTRRALCATAPAERRACATAEIPLAEGRAPSHITLLTPGPLLARDGRRWRLDDAAAVVAATRARAGSTDLVIDYEHQSVLAPRNGQPAPAAGWIRDLEVAGDGAIRARVEWTERARAAIEAREYRYLSPVFTHDPTGVVGVILSAALTATPALDLPALARDTGGTAMPEHLRRALVRLGIDPDAATEADVTSALARLDAGLAGADRTALATALGVAADTAPAELVARATALATPDPRQWVPRAEYARLEARVQASADDTAVAAVDAAIAAGQVAPSSREWALSYARTDPAGWAEFIKDAPALARALPPRTAPGAGTGGGAALTPEEAAVCRTLGVSETAFVAARTAGLAAGGAS